MPVLELPVLELPTSDHLHDQRDQRDQQQEQEQATAEAAGPTEQTWAIDDRVDWHVDTPSPAGPSPAGPYPAGPSPEPAVSASADGPVVEFDLQHLLRQHDADRASGSSTVAGIEVPEETDADIRAAVQAALAEIAAATRPGGDHEVPSILMQAALVADAETGLTPSPDLWDVAAPSASTPPPPPPPTAARPVVPILPDRAPNAAPLPSTTPVSDAPSDAATDAAIDAPEHDASESVDTPRVDEPVAPPVGGLRRLMGSRKP